jgi:hypothetical protein
MWYYLIRKENAGVMSAYSVLSEETTAKNSPMLRDFNYSDQESHSNWVRFETRFDQPNLLQRLSVRHKY